MSKHPTVFVVSSGRSGSTLLQSILNATQQIYIPQESDFITQAYPFYKDKTSYAAHDYEQLAAFFCLTTVQNWGLTKVDIANYLKREKPQTFGEIFASISRQHHQNENTEDLVWGIKRPVLIARLSRILSVYPDAKIVHVCRDGRDVFLSYQAVHKHSTVKFGPKGVIANALYWVDSLRRIEDFQSDQVFEIKYEDIISAPDKTLPALFGFLGLEYTPDILREFRNHTRNKQIVPKAFQKDTHTKLFGKLDPTNSKKYKLKMSKSQILLFEILSGSYLQKYNYPIEYQFTQSPFLDFLRKGFYFFARKVNNIRYDFRDKRSFNKANSGVILPTPKK